MERSARKAGQAATGTGGWILLFALAAVIFALDQTTKNLVVRNIAPYGPGYHVPIIGDWLRLAYSTNTGAAFGLFADRTMILTILALAAIPLLVFCEKYLPIQGWPAKICLGLLLGGTAGNLSDRMLRGHVVDFVSAGIGDLRWPSFNVADSSFVVGVLLLLFFALTQPQQQKQGDGA